MKSKLPHTWLLILITLCFSGMRNVKGQQSNTLYFMHQIPEANYLNPAVQAPCKFFIGIPVLSSMHINVAHSGFSANDLVSNAGGSYEFTPVNVINQPGQRNYFSSELYISLLQLGYKTNGYYFNFTIRERNDFNLFYPRDFFQFVLEGNTPFEGEEISLRRLDAQLNHYREYAFGLATDINFRTSAGIKLKVLFGKLNVTAPRTRVGLFTEDILFHLTLSGDLAVNSSMPLALQRNPDGTITLDERYSTNPLDIALNRKNLGVAFDAGITHNYNERITLAASVLDLGLIPYRSNQTRLAATGEYTYTGVSEGILEDETYFEDLVSQIEDSTDIDITYDNYIYTLPPKIYAGAEYEVNQNFTAGLVASAKIYRKKIPKSLTLFGNYNIYKNIDASASWSWMHRSMSNVGIGISLGRNPVQFYAVTDNLLAVFQPLNAQNVNLRIGLNIIFGCQNNDEEQHMISSDGCRWIDEAQQKRKKLMYKKRNSWFDR
ncbi:MAG: hypothetical protein GVY19_01740 [Bacteroidetes bacterium]|jgi:hypothetical protein|nr:hypothetical protein [Bacteroidota bacterium]